MNIMKRPSQHALTYPCQLAQIGNAVSVTQPVPHKAFYSFHDLPISKDMFGCHFWTPTTKTHEMDGPDSDIHIRRIVGQGILPLGTVYFGAI